MGRGKCLNRILNYMTKETSKKIAITEMCGGKKIVIQLYCPHSLNEDGIFMSFENQMAIVSRYLHNKGFKVDEDTVSGTSTKHPLFSDLFSVPFLTTDTPKFILQLGGDSTLLNASKSTNFNFKIEGAQFSDEEINGINSLNPKRNKVIDRVNAIKAKGGKLVFDRVDNPTFYNNLIMLDGDLPSVIASLLLEQLNSGVSTLKELVNRITEINPLGYDTRQPSPFYAYKVKHLLTSAALGMMPATAWDGRLDANGGYLVVKSDGDILCYHFYDRNRFEDYLFSNAYLEHSSTSRHNYASIIKEEDGTLSFKINFQVRLK